jgi:chemotaxis protein MotA
MDRLSLIGAVMAIAALLLGSVLKGAGLSALWSPAAFVIVICGTVAAILLQTPGAVFKRALKIVRWVFRPPTQDRSALIARLVGWSTVARK